MLSAELVLHIVFVFCFFLNIIFSKIKWKGKEECYSTDKNCNEKIKKRITLAYVYKTGDNENH